jgi:hypothetical protein
MGSAEHQAVVSAAVADAVKSFCTARARGLTPANAASRAGEVSRPTTAPAAAAPERTHKQH